MLSDYIESKPVLTTKRLTLRTLIPSDVSSLSEWMPDKSMYKYWGKNAGKSDLNPKLLFEKTEKPTKSFHWGIICNDDGKAIGEMWIYLIENDRMAKVAFRMSPAYQGKGYITEALNAVIEFCFTHTELKRLWTDVDIRNIPSVKVLEKCGFSREGHIRQGKMVSTYCDYYLYGILKDDFVNKQ